MTNTAAQTNSLVKRLSWLLVIISICVYANTLTHGFVLDDEAVVTKNSFVQKGIKGIPAILTSFYWQGYWNSNSGLYRPVSLILFAGEWQLVNDNPLVYHLVQIILFAVCIAMLFKLLRQYWLSNYTVWLSFFITLIFALHPLHTEVVANIKSADELLCLLFFLAATLSIYKQMNAWLTAVLLLLALLSKESALLFIPVWILMLWQLQQYTLANTFKKLLPSIIITVIWFAWHTYIIKTGPATITYTYEDNSLLSCGSWIEQRLTAISIMGLYLLKIVLPHKLSYDYSFNQLPCESFTSPTFWLSLLVIMGLLVIAIKWFRSKPLISFGILFYFIMVSLTSNIVFTIGATMGERFVFMPLLGIVMAIVIAVNNTAKIDSPKKLNTTVVLLLSTICIVFLIQTFIRNKDWESNKTLFASAIDNAPNSSRVHYNYGTILLNETLSGTANNMPEALEQLNTAKEINPNNYLQYFNLGIAYYHLGKYNEAVNILELGVRKIQNDTSQFINLADAYLKIKKYDSAVVNYKKAYNSKAWSSNLYNKYGTALFSIQKYTDAQAVFEKGLLVDANNTEMWLNYGNAMAVQKKYQASIAAFEKVLSMAPSNKQALYFLALSWRDLGDNAKAAAYYKQFQLSK